MENKSHAMAAGTFVLVVMALLVAMAMWLTRDTAAHLVYELSSRETVTGLQPQAAVKFRGVPVGKVTSIALDPVVRGNVLIRISTDDVAPITRSTFATLGFQGVTGLAFVQLDDTGESKDALVPDGGPPPRIPMRAGLLSKLSDQGASLLVQVEENSRRVNQLLDPANQKILFQAIQNLGQAATGLQQLATRADGVLALQLNPERFNLPQLAQDLGSTLKATQAMTDSVGRAADETRATAAEFKQVSQSLTKAGGPLDKLADSADALSALGQSANANTLPRLNRTTEQAARTARQISRVADAVTDNPQSLIFGNGWVAPGPGEAGFTVPVSPTPAKP
jgi:phospholipid/cholesterol/gamma-HCH transport system substrate-binding protein